MKTIKSKGRQLVLDALTGGGVRRWLQGWGYDIGVYPPDDAAALRSHLATLFSDLNINCVVDVGANRGQFARMIRRNGFDGRIISFEPVSQNFGLLTDQMADDTNWQGHQLALGASDGVAEINVTQKSVFSSFFQPNKYSIDRFGDESAIAHQETVQVRTLGGLFDSLVKEIQHPRVFLKMDTQGFDLDVLRGASSVLDRICGLQTELSMIPIYDGAPSYREALAFLEESNYQFTGFFAVNRDQRLRVAEFDCVCVRADR
jgi:FkbM family methyltransferase